MWRAFSPLAPGIWEVWDAASFVDGSLNVVAVPLLRQHKQAPTDVRV